MPPLGDGSRSGFKKGSCKSMNLLSTTPGFPLIALALLSPTILVLLGPALYFAENSSQRLVNLLLGFTGCLTTILCFVFNFRPFSNSSADENHGLLLFAIAPVGAAIGICLSLAIRRFKPMNFRSDGRNSLLCEPTQPGIICPKCSKWFSLRFVSSRTDSLERKVSLYHCTKCGEETEFASHHPANAV